MEDYGDRGSPPVRQPGIRRCDDIFDEPHHDLQAGCYEPAGAARPEVAATTSQRDRDMPGE